MLSPGNTDEKVCIGGALAGRMPSASTAIALESSPPLSAVPTPRSDAASPLRSGEPRDRQARGAKTTRVMRLIGPAAGVADGPEYGCHAAHDHARAGWLLLVVGRTPSSL
jgi:hypothetical protein